MSVEDEFKEENFIRLTRRSNTARVLAHILAPRLQDLFGRKSGIRHLSALHGQGWSNFALTVSFQGDPQEFILRLTEKPASAAANRCRSIAHFEKEHAILSRLKGLPFVPEIVPGGIGTLTVDMPGQGERIFAFMIEEKLPYVTARERGKLCNSTRALQQLGEICREIHSISCDGFGLDFNVDTRSFEAPSFETFIASKISTIESCAINEQMRRWLTARAEGLYQLQPEPKLFHRDLLGNPGNYLVDAEDNVRGIIDWEFAGSGAAFHYEVASMLYVLARDGHSAERIDHDLRAVLQGYGMTFATYCDDYERDVETLVLINSISAMLKYAELQKNGTSAREPWRKLFAERAEYACKQSFARDRLAGRGPRTAGGEATRKVA